MSRRLKMIIAYDGVPFSGWQSQSHRNTIQDHLERGFERVGGTLVRVHGAGRTDAGVHSLAQCAHVDLPNYRLLAARWITSLNSSLPATLLVLLFRYASGGFLYKMVRLIVGSLVHCALGKSRIENVTERLVSARASHRRFVAPAEGLFLVRVRY